MRGFLLPASLVLLPRSKNHKFSNRNGNSSVVESVKGVNRREEAEAETESLLRREENERGPASDGRRKKGSARKVQWNDAKGNNLVEVLEFHPSDTSDSDDEDLDSCFCIVM